MSAPVFGTGATITFGTSAFTANVVSIDFGEVKRESKNTTYLGSTTAESFLPTTLYDPGECKMKIQFDPAKGTSIPISAAAETITISLSGKNVAASGFVIGYSINIQTEQIVEAEIKVKYTGALTWS